MEETKNRSVFRYTLISLLNTAIVCLIPMMLIRNIGPIIRLVSGEDGTVAQVFDQLKGVRIAPPYIVAFALWMGFFLAADKLKIKKLPMWLIGVILFVVLLIVVLFFTSVNGIYFGDVIRSLLTYISNGLLDEL